MSASLSNPPPGVLPELDMEKGGDGTESRESESVDRGVGFVWDGVYVGTGWASVGRSGVAETFGLVRAIPYPAQIWAGYGRYRPTRPYRASLRGLLESRFPDRSMTGPFMMV